MRSSSISLEFRLTSSQRELWDFNDQRKFFVFTIPANNAYKAMGPMPISGRVHWNSDQSDA